MIYRHSIEPKYAPNLIIVNSRRRKTLIISIQSCSLFPFHKGNAGQWKTFFLGVTIIAMDDHLHPNNS